jgi:hypothetical protein
LLEYESGFGVDPTINYEKSIKIEMEGKCQQNWTFVYQWELVDPNYTVGVVSDFYNDILI